MNVLEEKLQSVFNKDVEEEFLITKSELDYLEEKMVETRIAQIAKKRWLREWDQNSKFFHATINQKWNASMIELMRLECGTFLASPKEI